MIIFAQNHITFSMIPKGKLISIGGNEDKGTEPEPNFLQKNNLNFFELQILSRIVQEAGGLVGDPQGGERHLERGDIIAANPKLFRQLLTVLAQRAGAHGPATAR